MEGISGFLIFGGITLAFVFLFILWHQFKKPVGTVMKLASPLLATIDVIIEVLPIPEENKTKVKQYLKILAGTVNSVNHQKTEIDETLPPNATAKQRHEAYKNAALELAEEIAKEQGIEVDVMSKTMINMAIDFLLSFFEKGEVTNVDLKKYINN